jgi:hypothetical protein
MLLVSHALIDRDEHVEIWGGAPEKLAIFEA